MSGYLLSNPTKFYKGDMQVSCMLFMSNKIGHFIFIAILFDIKKYFFKELLPFYYSIDETVVVGMFFSV